MYEPAVSAASPPYWDTLAITAAATSVAAEVAIATTLPQVSGLSSLRLPCLVSCLIWSSQTVNWMDDYLGTDSIVSSQLVIRSVHRLRTLNKAQDKTRRFPGFNS